MSSAGRPNFVLFITDQHRADFRFEEFVALGIKIGSRGGFQRSSGDPRQRGDQREVKSPEDRAVSHSR